LAAEADHHLTLLILGLDVHDAGGWVIGETEGEAPVGIRSRLMLLVEGDRCLAWFAQPSGDTQLPTRDHRLVDQDVGHGGRHARDKDGSDQQALEHRVSPLRGTKSPLNGAMGQFIRKGYLRCALMHAFRLHGLDADLFRQLRFQV
jgi:hypothetical protein